MKKFMCYSGILCICATTAMAVEQCKVLSDAEYTGLYNNHTTSVDYNVFEDGHLESTISRFSFKMNGDFSLNMHFMMDQHETMRIDFNGHWSIHHSTLTMNVSECHHTQSQDPSENTTGDEICSFSLGEGELVSHKINPCDPFDWEDSEGSTDNSVNRKANSFRKLNFKG